MKDIFIGSQGENKWQTETDKEALRSQMGMFLISETRALDYDLDYGLDYEKILLNSNVANELKENYIKNKIQKYFDKYLINPSIVRVTNSNRKLSFEVIYFSIYGGEDTVTI